MRYYFNYQYLPKGADRPVDAGSAIHISDEKAEKPPSLPAVGDYVEINPVGVDKKRFQGRVKSRLFRYSVDDGTDPDLHVCRVNIVLEEDDMAWHQLIAG